MPVFIPTKQRLQREAAGTVLTQREGGTFKDAVESSVCDRLLDWLNRFELDESFKTPMELSLLFPYSCL